MQSITTKYIGPTSTRGSRIKAKTTSGHHVTRAYDYTLSQDANHRAVAERLAVSLGWTGDWVEGALNESGNVYVCQAHGTNTFTVS